MQYIVGECENHTPEINMEVIEMNRVTLLDIVELVYYLWSLVRALA
jgi:hypothetical protein